MKTPCLNCEFRHVGCHADCEHYKAFRAEREAAYKRNAQQAEMTSFVSDVKRNVHRRYGRLKK